MSHYIQYWAPPRAALAFDAAFEPVVALENGWFSHLAADDTLWVASLVAGKLVLVLRGDVTASPRKLSSHPIYAIRNSPVFNNYRVRFDPASASRPFAVPLPARSLARLRFHGQSDRLSGDLTRDLFGPLGSLRRLQESAIPILENLWADRAHKEWLKLTIVKGGKPAFATVEHRQLVERKSVSLVRRYYEQRGWKVVSRERDGVGYDLECTRGRKALHVEVKGTANDYEAFFMTPGEYGAAQRDRDFRLAVVTEALGNPRLHFYTGARMKQAFGFTPMMYSAARTS